MQKIIKQFPVLSQYTYLNTATSGLLYDGLLEWRQEHDLDFLIGGSQMKMTSHVLMDETRNSIGNVFGCPKENIALVPNFSIGLNMLLEGIGNRKNVLLMEDDYPSLNWPFESRGCKVTYTAINENLEENIHNKIKTGHIDILALSLVQWLSGIKIDLEFLRELKKEFPNLVIIADGTQYLGTESFNFRESGIDVLAASSYKWLLGGYGNGFMMFGDGMDDKFSPLATGFNAVKGKLEDKEGISFAERFEPGHLDSLNFGSLNYSLGFLSDIGMDHIGDKIGKLTQKAKETLGGLGLLEEAVMNRKNHSSIFNIKGDKQMHDKLMRQNVICALRGNGIRLSFHIYNTENEIDKLAEMLK